MELNNEQIMYWTRINHELWNVCIAATKDGLCYVGSQNKGFQELEDWVKTRRPNYSLKEDAGKLKPFAIELTQYLQGQLREFSYPIYLQGTPFQMSVWKALQEVPFGNTVSYSEIAKRINKPKSVRAVGTAIGANPILITVPCHRVVAKSGALTGYRGGLEMKQQLLALEGKGI